MAHRSILFVLALAACTPREQRSAPTTTSSSELTLDSGGAAAETTAVTQPQRPSTPPARRLQAVADAGRLSEVGSAVERDKNLGILERDGGLAPATVALPPPQLGAGAVISPPRPMGLVGAGQPGGAANPHYY
jgi:hypothetical protein